jgi:hypothetical protein
MTAGDPTTPQPSGAAPRDPSRDPRRDPRRERLIALLALGIAVVLMVSSLTWFGTGQQGVGLGQLFLGVVLAVVGFVLYQRSQRR